MSLSHRSVVTFQFTLCALYRNAIQACTKIDWNVFVVVVLGKLGKSHGSSSTYTHSNCISHRRRRQSLQHYHRHSLQPLLRRALYVHSHRTNCVALLMLTQALTVNMFRLIEFRFARSVLQSMLHSSTVADWKKLYCKRDFFIVHRKSVKFFVHTFQCFSAAPHRTDWRTLSCWTKSIVTRDSICKRNWLRPERASIETCFEVLNQDHFAMLYKITQLFTWFFLFFALFVSSSFLFIYFSHFF